MIFKLIHPTLGTTLGVFTTRSAAKREAARANFPTEIVEVEAMALEGLRAELVAGKHASAAPLPSAPEARALGAAEVGQGFRSPATCPKCGGRLDRMIPTPNGVSRKKCQGCDMVYKVS